MRMHSKKVFVFACLHALVAYKSKMCKASNPRPTTLAYTCPYLPFTCLLTNRRFVKASIKGMLAQICNPLHSIGLRSYKSCYAQMCLHTT